MTAFLSCALDCGENENWPTQEFGEITISRAKKLIWWGENKKALHVSPASARMFQSIWWVCLSVCESKSLTRVRSQNVEILSCNSPATSASQPCGDNDGVGGNLDVEVQVEVMGSEYYLWLRDQKLVVIPSDIAPCRWSEWWLVFDLVWRPCVAAWHAVKRCVKFILRVHSENHIK